jgi:hypothetical protein
MVRAVRVGAAVLAIGLGCNREVPREATAGPGAAPAAQGPALPDRAAPRSVAESRSASKEKRVYDVGSVNDLLEVQSAYQQQAGAGFDGRFEVRFTASIPSTGWSLAPEPGKDVPAIDLVLTGQGAVVPVPGKLIARSVRIEGLVLTGPAALSSAIEVRDSVAIVDSAVIDGRGAIAASQAPYLALRAHGVRGKKVPATLTVERSWFVRNWQASQSAHGAALVGLEQHERDGGFFKEARFRDCVFLGNAFGGELRLTHVLDVAIERCLFYKTWPSGVQIDAEMVEKVRVVDSIVVAEDLEHVARLGKDVPAIAMTGTRIYARSYKPSTAVPAAIKIDRGAIADRAGIDAKVAPVDAAAKMPVAMPAAALRDQLMQALRP